MKLHALSDLYTTPAIHSSIGDGGSGPCCAKNPTQKKTGLTGNPKVKYFRNVRNARNVWNVRNVWNAKVKFPKVKWETTKKPEKTGFNWKNRKNGKV